MVAASGCTMPREIITVQLGQCGNQSKEQLCVCVGRQPLSLFIPNTTNYIFLQLGWNFGSSCVQSMASTQVGLVSQATPFTERGRVWSRCNYRVVAEERNY